MSLTSKADQTFLAINLSIQRFGEILFLISYKENCTLEMSGKNYILIALKLYSNKKSYFLLLFNFKNVQRDNPMSKQLILREICGLSQIS